MRLFVTGWDGLCGRALREAARRAGGFRVTGGDLPGLDVLRRRQLIARVIRERPDFVVHLAAWTDVDGCEGDPRRAALANGCGAGHAADAARAAGARLLHVSTDYVFDGRGRRPYTEDDPVNPLSAYGRSKLQGEREVMHRLPAGRWTIVRGQSLYGAARKSFPDAILRLARTGGEVPVVTDQVVQPTWARDFAGILLAVLRLGTPGVLHAAAGGSCTWNEFARATVEDAGVSGARITDTTAAAFGRPAPRPSWSVFDCGRLARTTGLLPRPWRAQLRDYLACTGRAA